MVLKYMAVLIEVLSISK